MKKIGIVLAMIGCTISGYVQTKACSCSRVVHKTAYHKTVRNKKINRTAPLDIWGTVFEIVGKQDEPCYQYKQHNIVVTECPGVSSDNIGPNSNNGYETESSYMGYYPQNNNSIKGAVAPQHITIDNYYGIAPAGANACNANCTAK